MANHVHSVSDSSTISANGTYRLNFPGGEGQVGKRHFSAAWTGSGNPAGTLAFSFDGNAGDPPATMNLAAGDNSFSWNVRIPFVDIAVSGLPTGGQVTVYCR